MPGANIHPQHLASLLRNALGEDPRCNVLDLEIRVVGGKLHLQGEVPSVEVLRAIETIVRELAPELELVSRLLVGGIRSEPHSERIQ